MGETIFFLTCRRLCFNSHLIIQSYVRFVRRRPSKKDEKFAHRWDVKQWHKTECLNKYTRLGIKKKKKRKDSASKNRQNVTWRPFFFWKWKLDSPRFRVKSKNNDGVGVLFDTPILLQHVRFARMFVVGLSCKRSNARMTFVSCDFQRYDRVENWRKRMEESQKVELANLVNCSHLRYTRRESRDV